MNRRRGKPISNSQLKRHARKERIWKMLRGQVPREDFERLWVAGEFAEVP